jgi:HAD superfamily hydrolase (TIGR01509 family)
MRKLQAVIFDMDGVLIDSEPIHYEVENRIYDLLGIEVTDEIHLNYLGTSNDFMYSDLKSRFNLAASVDELIKFDDDYRCEYLKNLEVVDLNNGVLDLLIELKAEGLKLAVATSSSPDIANVLLERCGIKSFFDIIVTTSDSGKSKPAPDVYLLAAERLGVIPEDCIVFEDSPNGLSAAKSADMYCIVIQNDKQLDNRLKLADYRIGSFTELTFEKLQSIIQGK